MKIAVYGATGMVGKEIVAEALSRGHEVTAVTRSGTAVAGTTAVAAELADAATLADLAAGHDVVVLATGPGRSGESHEPWVDAVTGAYDAVGDTRLLVVGGAGALTIDGARLVDSPDFPEAYKPEALTMARIYDAVTDARPNLNWTMLAPAPMIQPGERTGSYVTGGDSPVGQSISTQDFAVAMLDEIETPAHPRARFTAAN